MTSADVKKMILEIPDLVRRIDAMTPEGSVVLPRDRVERLLRCAESSHEWFNAPYNPDAEAGGEVWAAAEQSLGNAAKALQPGDLDPLP
jgi:hypothetical protein